MFHDEGRHVVHAIRRPQGGVMVDSAAVRRNTVSKRYAPTERREFCAGIVPALYG